MSLAELFEKYRANVTRLPKELCEGVVEKLSVMVEEDDIKVENGKAKEISIIRLAPNSCIKVHQHVNDEELYVSLYGAGVFKCGAGEWHNFNNDTSNEIYLISIKYVRR